MLLVIVTAPYPPGASVEISPPAAVLLIAVRTYRLVFYPELLGGQYQIKPVE